MIYTVELNLCRYTVAAILIYHGLIPKLIFQHASEVNLVMAHGFSATTSEWIILLAGLGELVFAGSVLRFSQHRWLWWLVISFMAGLLIDVALFAPGYLVAAFNPVSLNIAVIALSLIALHQINHATHTHC